MKGSWSSFKNHSYNKINPVYDGIQKSTMFTDPEFIYYPVNENECTLQKSIALETNEKVRNGVGPVGINGNGFITSFH